MRVNTISATYASKNQLRATNSVQRSSSVQNTPNFTTNKPYAVISFTGKNKEQVLFIGAEVEPYFKIGGVATVMNDYKSFHPGQNAMVIPYYNGKVEYDENGKPTGKVKVHTFPEGHELAGKPFYTSEDLSQKSIDEVIKEKKYIEIEHVQTKKMQWGLEPDSQISLFRSKDKPNEFLLFVDSTATMTKPYDTGANGAGGYGTLSDNALKSFSDKSWNGDPYAKFDKAAVELMPDISKAIPGFEPATVICSDSQTAYIPHYMAKQNANGVDYFKSMKPTYVVHNLGQGYCGETSAKNMFVNMGATPDEINALKANKGYIEALHAGNSEGFLKKYMPNLVDDTDIANPSIIPFRYAKSKYVTAVTTVSDGYAKALANNPELSPGLHKYWKESYDAGIAKGILNPLNDPNLNPFGITDKDGNMLKTLPLDGYGKELKVHFKDGKEEVLEPFKPFIKEECESLNLEHKKEIKRQNKIKLFERFDPKYNDIAERNALLTGTPKRKASLIGSIDPKWTTALKNGEDVNLFVSWGRGDFQKGLDTVLMAFEDLVLNKGDENSVLVLGGELPEGAEKDKILKQIEKMNNNQKLQGRFVYMDGFAPNAVLASAGDASIFPSRFAPCELTDLESKKYFCTSLVTNCQGLAQKNFDPRIEAEKSMADAYKTTHEYYMGAEELKKVSKPFSEGVEKLREAEELLLHLKMGAVGNDEAKKITRNSLIKQNVENSKAYKALYRTCADNVITSELVDCMLEFKKGQADTETAKLLFSNQLKMKTNWNGNAALTEAKKSSQELYEEIHLNPVANDISKEKVNGVFDTSLFKNSAEAVQEAAQDGFESATKKAKRISNKQIAGLVFAGVALAGGIAYIAKKNKKKPEQPSIASVTTPLKADTFTPQAQPAVATAQTPAPVVAEASKKDAWSAFNVK